MTDLTSEDAIKQLAQRVNGHMRDPANRPAAAGPEGYADYLEMQAEGRALYRKREAEKRRTSGAPGIQIVGLSELLARPAAATMWRIDGIMERHAKVLIVAQAKAGKTHVGHNYVRAIVDGDSFLGHYEVEQMPDNRCVVIFDNELGEMRTRAWLERQGIANLRNSDGSDRVVVVNLEGMGWDFDLRDLEVRHEWAERLRELNPWALFFDCLRPQLDALGMNEHAEASRFLDALAGLRTECGAEDIVVSHHMGHEGSRARGDSGILGWYTQCWLLHVDGDSPAFTTPRHFSVIGRDVIDSTRKRLELDPYTEHLTFTEATLAELAGNGTRKSNARLLEDELLAALKALDVESNSRGWMYVSDAVKLSGKSHTEAKRALDALVRAGKVIAGEEPAPTSKQPDKMRDRYQLDPEAVVTDRSYKPESVL